MTDIDTTQVESTEETTTDFEFSSDLIVGEIDTTDPWFNDQYGTPEFWPGEEPRFDATLTRAQFRAIVDGMQRFAATKDPYLAQLTIEEATAYFREPEATPYFEGRAPVVGNQWWGITIISYFAKIADRETAHLEMTDQQNERRKRRLLQALSGVQPWGVDAWDQRVANLRAEDPQALSDMKSALRRAKTRGDLREAENMVFDEIGDPDQMAAVLSSTRKTTGVKTDTLKKLASANVNSF